jgi:hypothetical protein
MILDLSGHNVLIAHISNEISWLYYLSLKFNEIIPGFCVQVTI